MTYHPVKSMTLRDELQALVEKWLTLRMQCTSDEAGGAQASVFHHCAHELRDLLSRDRSGEVSEVRLWDTQWMSIVNHDDCYSGWSKGDAIAHAVKMTELAIARNVMDGKLPTIRESLTTAHKERT